jgi:hypothetical protein
MASVVQHRLIFVKFGDRTVICCELHVYMVKVIFISYLLYVVVVQSSKLSYTGLRSCHIRFLIFTVNELTLRVYL